MKKLLLFTVALLATFSLKAYDGEDFTVNGINYTVISESEKTCMTKAGSRSGDDIVSGNTNLSGSLKLTSLIVKDGENYTLTEIGDYSFFNCSNLIGLLTIPDSVQAIGDFAFYGCAGFKVLLSIGDNVQTIGRWAFYGCSGFTDSLTIPNSVQAIGECAFYKCSGFTGSLTIPNSVQTIGAWAFFECSGFNGSLTIPNNVQEIEYAVFYGCSGFTGSLTIPNNVQTIGAYAFSDCSGLTGSITIPNSVQTIGDFAFFECSGFNGLLTIGDSVQTIGDAAFSYCSGLKGSLTIGENVQIIGGWAFYGCSGLTGDLIIPESVIQIGGGAFSYTEITNFYVNENNPNFCTINGVIYNEDKSVLIVAPPMITTFDWVDAITKIGDYAFCGCSGLAGSLTIPDSVETIGNWAFAGCSGLIGSLTIGDSVLSIGNGAFNGCYGFENVISNAEVVPVIEETTFDTNIYATAPLYVPEKSLDQYKNAVGWKEFNNILSIDEYGSVAGLPEDDVYTIYDLQGRLVNAKGTINDLKQLPSGIYIINGKKIVK